MKRIITIEEVQEITFTPQSLMGVALRQTPHHINVGDVTNGAFLDALNTGHCGCLVTPPFVPDDGTLQRIRRLMDEGDDDEQ
ncbi:hypothetical protein S576_23595 [Salmonella enterica subsp. enterica serovar Give]|nr:hypothetical protein [Salmonella enterica subsp. enterica serovar Give]EED4548138.1 hypothetical protein [Salmonella enterica subsp. enterica serovar Give]